MEPGSLRLHIRQPRVECRRAGRHRHQCDRQRPFDRPQAQLSPGRQQPMVAPAQPRCGFQGHRGRHPDGQGQPEDAAEVRADHPGLRRRAPGRARSTEHQHPVGGRYPPPVRLRQRRHCVRAEALLGRPEFRGLQGRRGQHAYLRQRLAVVCARLAAGDRCAAGIGRAVCRRWHVHRARLPVGRGDRRLRRPGQPGMAHPGVVAVERHRPACLQLCRCGLPAPAPAAARAAGQVQPASVGLGAQLRLGDHLQLRLDYAWPYADGPVTRKDDPRLHFNLSTSY